MKKSGRPGDDKMRKLAKHLGVHLATAYRWTKSDSFPRDEHGRPDFENTAAIDAWHAAKKAETAERFVAPPTGSTPPVRKTSEEEDKWRIEILRLRAEKEALIVAEMRGDLIGKDEAKKAWCARIVVVTRFINSLPTRLGYGFAGLEPEQCVRKLQEECHHALSEFCAIDRLTPSVEGEDGDGADDSN